MTVYGFSAGVISGLLGIAGGFIIIPVLIDLKLPPDVVTYTNSYMVLFTAISNFL